MAPEVEMDARRVQLKADLRGLVDTAIFGWDVPEVDETLAG